jgi:hypothetical protein
MGERRDPVLSMRMPEPVRLEIEKQVDKQIEIRSKRRAKGLRYDQAKPGISSWILEACLQRLRRTRTAVSFCAAWDEKHLRQTYDTAVELLKEGKFL